MEWNKNNTFGTTAFTSYCLFWLTLLGLLVLPKMGLGVAASKTAMAAYLFVWGLFTLVMFVGTLKLNRALQFVFGSLTLLFSLLALGDATGNASISTIARFEGIICGFSAPYTQAWLKSSMRFMARSWPSSGLQRNDFRPCDLKADLIWL